MVCKNCGKQIANDAKFCRYCGDVISGGTGTEETLPFWGNGQEETTFDPSAAPANKACHNCGSMNAAYAQFCKNCGVGLGSAASSAAPSFVSAPVVPPAAAPAPAPVSSAPPSKSNNTVLIVVLVAALVVALALAAVAAFQLDWFDFSDAQNEDDTKPVETSAVSPDEKPVLENTPEPGTMLSENINTYLSGMNHSGNVSVAVYDNASDRIYLGGASGTIHPAWGFYVPVYLAAGDFSNIDYTTRVNIMSADIGVCNQAGNTAIRAMGGPGAVTSHLASRYNASATSYGRYFADLNATGENYTNVKEASEFLAILNDRGEYTRLSYNPSGFGITVPSGATYYCQVGTENKAKLDKLNFFAVVKGQYSDYCIAVMSQNGAGKTSISGLLNVVHTEMERMYA